MNLGVRKKLRRLDYLSLFGVLVRTDIVVFRRPDVLTLFNLLIGIGPLFLSPLSEVKKKFHREIFELLI